MSLRHIFLVTWHTCLWLHGCGSGGSDKPKPAPASKPKTTVIVMRHCVRATRDDGIVAKPPFVHFNDYSAKKWPKFPSKAMSCTPRGEKIVEAQGAYLKSQGGLPLPVRAIADVVPDGQRDNVTMTNLLKGLAMHAKDFSMGMDFTPFAKGNSTECNKLKMSETEMSQAMLDFMKAHPPPKDYQKLMKKLHKALGEGAAGNWMDIPCTVGAKGRHVNSRLKGACYAASQFAERFLMEWGSGMTIGWGKVAAEDVPALMKIHAWCFYINYATPAIYKWQGAAMLKDISSRLHAAEPGTTLYVGHDDDIMRITGALGLSYDAKPFPTRATLPGSMIRFDRDGDTVTASYHYVESFTDEKTFGTMKSVPAEFKAGSNQVSLKHFNSLVQDGTFAACATGNPAPTSDAPTSFVAARSPDDVDATVVV